MGVFRFKQFAVDDTGCGMKTSTDAVLLGAWVPLPPAGKVLDAGCGSGIIGMMIAQRNPQLQVTGVEIEPEAARQAMANVAGSPFTAMMQIIHTDVRTFSPNPPALFDLIVCNPPYFRDSLKSPREKTNLARHNITLDDHELLDASRRLLASDGSLCVVLPFARHTHFLKEAAIHGFHPAYTLLVQHKPDARPVLVLLKLSFNAAASPSLLTLCIRNADNSWSEAYLRLTRDFYLFA